MLFLLLLACGSSDRDNPDIEVGSENLAPTRLELVTVSVCAVLTEDSPGAPGRLIFLHRTDRGDLDAQSELTAFNDSPLRCADVDLGFEPGRDGTEVYFDYMPREPATIAELRLYRNDVPWAPQNPYAIAIEDHRPFRDYAFRVNLAHPAPQDPHTLFVRVPP